MSRRDDQGERESAGTGDPLIDDVRAARRWLCEQVDHDVSKLISHLQELEARHPERVIRELPRESPREREQRTSAEGNQRSGWEDPLIDEVRAIRREISERFDNDVDKLCDHLCEVAGEYPERIVGRADELPPAREE